MKEDFNWLRIIIEEKQTMDSLLRKLDELDINSKPNEVESNNFDIDLKLIEVELINLSKLLPYKFPSEFKDPLNFINNLIKKGPSAEQRCSFSVPYIIMY